MHSTAKSTFKRTLKRSGKMIKRGKSFKESTGNTTNQRSTRNISKKNGKENKKVPMYLGFQIAVMRATET